MDETHYADRTSVELLDRHNALGAEKLAALCVKHIKRYVAIQLTNQKCKWCGSETDYFFELACARVCMDCLVSNSGAQMCSLDYAKVCL